MAKPNRWAVIEYAGYEGECVVASDFSHWQFAQEYVNNHYDRDEQEDMRVDIAFWDAEQECWSYDH
jgi:hypothetical protein